MKQHNIMYVELGGRIAQYRKKAGLNQEQLAGAVKLTRTSIVNIEKGKQHLTVWTLVLICSTLKCKITDLFPKIPKASFREIIKKTKVIQYKTMEADFKF